MSRAPRRGDRVQVDYFDLVADINGDPASADLARGSILGFYWGDKRIDGVDCLLVTITQWEDGDWQQGYHLVPSSLVRKIRVV